jgi:hypothetical protein
MISYLIGFIVLSVGVLFLLTQLIIPALSFGRLPFFWVFRMWKKEEMSTEEMLDRVEKILKD